MDAAFARWRTRAAVVGLAGLLLTVVGAVFSRAQFFESYLWAFLFWFSIALGCLPLLMIYHLVGGSWGFTIRRIIESGIRTLPLMALLFIPVLFGIHDLYEWSRSAIVAQSKVLQDKRLYLNTPFWIIRAAFYFGVWVFYARRLTSLSRAEDQGAATARRSQRLSAPGLIVYGLTISFAAFDWAMSLEPEWYSTIYGMWWMVSQALAALAFSIVVLTWVSDRPPLSNVARPGVLQDLGNLLLAFVILWAYLSFSQLLIIWSGNLPEEIPWYLSRLRHGWQWVAVALLVFHFGTPFFLLLSRFVKRRVRMLGAIALLILAARALDMFWVIAPAFYRDRIAVHWLDLFAFVGVGGIWLAAYVRALASVPLVALNDPNAIPHKAI